MIEKVLMDRAEFQHYILDFIGSKKYEEILASMSYTNPEFKQGFIQGLIWASLLSVKLPHYYLKGDE